MQPERMKDYPVFCFKTIKKIFMNIYHCGQVKFKSTCSHGDLDFTWFLILKLQKPIWLLVAA